MKDEPLTEQTRTETDSLGSVEIPADAYWGIHTARALENFPIAQAAHLGLPRPRRRARHASSRPRRARTARSACSTPRRPTSSTGPAQRIIDGELPRPVRRRRHPGRRRHVDEHERQRGHHQPRARARRPREGRLRRTCIPIDDVNRSQSHERRVPDGASRSRWPSRCARCSTSSTCCASRSRDKGREFARRPEGRPHPAAGRRADDPRARSSTASPRPSARTTTGSRETACAARRDQHGRDGDRHRHHAPTRLRGGGRPAPARDHRARPR